MPMKHPLSWDLAPCYKALDSCKQGVDENSNNEKKNSAKSQQEIRLKRFSRVFFFFFFLSPTRGTFSSTVQSGECK